MLIVFTPLGDSEQRLDREGGEAIPDLQLDRAALAHCFAGLTVREERIQSQTQYGEETIFYVSR